MKRNLPGAARCLALGHNATRSLTLWCLHPVVQISRESEIRDTASRNQSVTHLAASKNGRPLRYCYSPSNTVAAYGRRTHASSSIATLGLFRVWMLRGSRHAGCDLYLKRPDSRIAKTNATSCIKGREE